MIPFLPVADGVLVTLQPDDLDLLNQLPEFLSGLGSPETDPAAARLRSPVYREDHEASLEWWRLMSGEIDQARIADRSAFALILEAASGGTVASTAEAEAFLRVLNDARLALAARLGVAEEGDYGRLEEDDQAALDYLAGMQHLLIVALTGGSVER
ncbi:MAG: DUF2017 family protein [Actinomycetota bacterium]